MTATPARELEQTPFTASDLTAWVHETMDANGGDRGAAIRKVVTDLADQMRGEARMWWLSLGHEMVRHVVGGRERAGHRYTSGGVPPSEQNESRFSEDRSPLDAWVSYSSSASERAKPLREFTEDEWRSFAAMRRKQADTMLDDAEHAKQVAGRLDGETTGEAWGDLPENLREWVEDVAGR